jgi:hypothetical protein
MEMRKFPGNYLFTKSMEHHQIKSKKTDKTPSLNLSFQISQKGHHYPRGFDLLGKTNLFSN